MQGVAHKVIAQQLEPGESLLWAGQPRKGIIFRSSDAVLIPFSLMWGGFAVFWEASVLKLRHSSQPTVPVFVALWGIPFVLVGLYLVFGRFVVDALQREHTYYGITDRRILIVTEISERRPAPNLTTVLAAIIGLGRRKISSLELHNAGVISMTENRNGSGTITFGSPTTNSFFTGTGWPGMNRSSVPAFESVERVKSVYEQICEARRKAS